MIIEIGDKHYSITEIKPNAKVTIKECYVGIGLETPSGTYGISQRDGGIEILLDGESIFYHQKEESK